MKGLKFKVDRKRDDGKEQIVECFVPMNEERARKIDIVDDNYDEDEYNRFCDEVWKYVKDQHNLETGYNWYFDNSPRYVEM